MGNRLVHLIRIGNSIRLNRLKYHGPVLIYSDTLSFNFQVLAILNGYLPEEVMDWYMRRVVPPPKLAIHAQ